MKSSILTGLFVRPQKSALAGLSFALALINGTVWADAADGRQVIELTAAQRAHVLGEMRVLLSGTQTLLAALAADDMAAVARQASALGMHMGHKAENHLHDVLPPAFMQLGMAVHQDFDRIAADAESRKDTKHSLQQLSTTLSTCAVCHEAYQIQLIQPQQKQ
ncbi:hypothetical protein [Methylomonas methanica]|uniref:Cytochrome C n=1 Tax=Methylomonas methanica (strain DSM 25384 / MC09) TaxID=857087 RepID=G0A5D9_METMM|nr:hypothetical protein [Methylomonas methanica]AEG01645.1 hypothetical protein Metme_3273 [Methylomonas methanica MC09]